MKITFGLAPQHRDAIGRVAMTGRVTPGDWPLMRDLAGAINQAWDAATILPVPPPDPADPLARMRIAPGQLSMWRNVTDIEVRAMVALYPGSRVAQQIAFYQSGGVGNVASRQTGPSTYDYVMADQWVPDVNGAGDALVARNAADAGLPVIGPLSP